MFDKQEAGELGQPCCSTSLLDLNIMQRKQGTDAVHVLPSTGRCTESSSSVEASSHNLLHQTSRSAEMRLLQQLPPWLLQLCLLLKHQH